MPALKGEFLAMSVFFFAMHCLHELGPAELTEWPAPSLAELREAAEGFCAMDWRALSLDDTVSERCLRFGGGGSSYGCVLLGGRGGLAELREKERGRGVLRHGLEGTVARQYGERKNRVGV